MQRHAPCTSKMSLHTLLSKTRAARLGRQKTVLRSPEMKLKELFTARHVPFEVVEHPTSWCASRLAEATHTPGKGVAKAVLLHADHGYIDVIAVVPADHKLDLNKVSRLLGGAEVHLASEDDIVRHCPHCERGALPPFGS